ncbi:MAG: hypothetical protein ACT4NX_10330 [Deltaproteobacteria bacterium]
MAEGNDHRRRIYAESKAYVEGLDEAQIAKATAALGGDEMRLVMMAYLDGASRARALLLVEVRRRMAQTGAPSKPPRELLFGCG